MTQLAFKFTRPGARSPFTGFEWPQGEWVEAAEASGLRELKAFAIGLKRDWEAVVAGMTLEWSAGPTEGHVNRVKALKRQMFGRAGVDLLRKRVLLAS